MLQDIRGARAKGSLAKDYSRIDNDTLVALLKTFSSIFQWGARRAVLAPLAPLSGTVSLPDTAGLWIGGANRASAAFIERRFDPVASEFFLITHLVTDREEFIFDRDLEWSYRFLEPGYLYNVDDLRFHRLSAALEPLPGPRPLASGGQAFGDYHVVGLR